MRKEMVSIWATPGLVEQARSGRSVDISRVRAPEGALVSMHVEGAPGGLEVIGRCRSGRIVPTCCLDLGAGG